MDSALSLFYIALGLLPGAWISWRLSRLLRVERDAAKLFASEAGEREANLREELAGARASARSDDQLLDSFRSISSQVIESQSHQLLQLAETKYGALALNTDLILGTHTRAVDAGLKDLGEKLRLFEQQRAESVGALNANVQALSTATARTSEEAAKLSSALRDNRVRGLWGEVQLRRTLELAGMDRHVDFVEQHGVSANGTTGRPDVIVGLPNGRSVVIDSKAPLDRYLASLDAADTDAQQALRVEHSKAVAQHVRALAGRSYAEMVPGSVDMVLMFLPGDSFLAAALDADPALFEMAVDKGIHLVTPSSLVPLLRGIALGWRELRAEQSAKEIHQIGVELHDRIAMFATHYEKVGTNLAKTVNAFNDSVGSFDRRLLASARRLADNGASSTRNLPEPTEIENRPRWIATPITEPVPAEKPVQPEAEPLGPGPADPSIGAAVQEVLDHR